MKWLFLLRPELKPTRERIIKLENIREKYGIPHNAFALGLLSYPSTAKLLQASLYKQVKTLNPDMSEKNILKSVFYNRAIKPKPLGYGMTIEEFNGLMDKINSLEELCDYVGMRERKSLTYPKWKSLFMIIAPNLRKIEKDKVKEKINDVMEEEFQKVILEIRKNERGKTTGK